MKKTAKTKKFNMRLTEKQFESLKENAKAVGFKTVSDFVRAKCVY